MLCACGVCGQEIKKGSRYILGHNRKGKTKENDEGCRKVSEKLGGKTYEEIYGKEKAEKLINKKKEEYIGKGNPMFGRKHPDLSKRNKENNPMKDLEVRKRMADTKTGRTKETHEYIKRQAEKQSKIMKSRTKKNNEGRRRQAEKQAEFMRNGRAAWVASFNENPSKEELRFRQIAFQSLPRPIHNYPIYRVGKGKRSYNVDIADSSLGIVLEFDGWYHFSSEERKEYDKKRQKEIEEEGWKFLRYNIFQPFPTLEQLKEDILKII